MHLVYLDESGNSGLNLNDPQQPIFCLCAMVVAETNWQALENALKHELDRTFPDWRKEHNFEIHGVEMRTGRGRFKGMKVDDRIAFRDRWMDVGKEHGVRLMSRTVNKKMFRDWLIKSFGQNIVINPHAVAFATLSRCIDIYLKSQGPALGMLISDDNKEMVADLNARFCNSED